MPGTFTLPVKTSAPVLASVKRALRAGRPVLPATQASSRMNLEGEDAVMTGMTRSLQRRLIGLNFPVVARATSLKTA